MSAILYTINQISVHATCWKSVSTSILSYPVIKRATNDSFDVNETIQYIYFDAVHFSFWGLLGKYLTYCKINCQGRYLAHKLELLQMLFSDYFIYISCIFTFFRESQLLFSLRFFNTRPWRHRSHHIWSKFENSKIITNKFFATLVNRLE